MSGETANRKTEIDLADFKRFLSHLDLDPANAWEKYEELQRKLIVYFEHHGHYVEAIDLAQEVFDEIARKPAFYTIENIGEFAFGVARNVRMRVPRRRSRMVRLEEGDELSPRDGNPEATIVDKMDADQKLSCFLLCMRRLSPEERWLILQYYPAEGEHLRARRQRLAQMLGIDLDALRTRISRLKDRILSCFGSCCKGLR